MTQPSNMQHLYHWGLALIQRSTSGSNHRYDDQHG